MRIISGTHKSRRIIAPSNLPTRPTTDYAKEALFNLIGNEFDLEKAEVLDLFAGIGGITFEFASRGVKKIVCIDQHSGCINFLKKTTMELKFSQIRVLRNDVYRYLKKCDSQFKIIFADPPYDQKNINEIPEIVFGKDLLTENGMLILEHDKNWDFSTAPNFSFHKKYSNVNFSFFEK
jgi:16S rRNA (guanine(966)-N(2))-methyltransferase RsmD